MERSPEVGKDVCLALMLTNHTSEPKAVEAHMTAWTIVYTGKPIHEVWKNAQSVTLGPKEGGWPFRRCPERAGRGGGGCQRPPCLQGGCHRGRG